jgi:3-hydroxymyristoyl/3-hydroxydecanoyl-(acyl carrier protein) dehydratase
MSSTTTIHVPAQHPSFEGHFPGAPLLPGVVLLDEMLQALGPVASGGGWSISTAKFLHPVRPGETLTLEHEPPLANGAVRFTIRSASAGQAVATGTLIPRPVLRESEQHGHQAR